ncbi:MAG: aspartate/glutamate racemase family protein [Acidobacteriota bacterium]
MSLPASIGIIGGVGPWVDALLLRKLLEYQTVLGMRRDQDAIPTLLAQFAALIEDRTEYLMSLERGGALENPAINAARIARMLAASGARVLGIPCNTFHAGPIFSRFAQEVAGLTGLPIVHMVQATIADILAARPEVHRVGILSTNGTWLHRIYSAPLEAAALQAVTLPLEAPTAPTQNDVHHAITNTEWGIKSGREAWRGYPRARAILKAAALRLQQLGAEVAILGCTEIPLALAQADVPDLPLQDPLDSLAKGLVDAYRAGLTGPPAAPAPPLPPA